MKEDKNTDDVEGQKALLILIGLLFYPKVAEANVLMTDKAALVGLSGLQEARRALWKEIALSIEGILADKNCPRWELGQERLFSDLKKGYEAFKNDDLPTLESLTKLLLSIMQVKEIIRLHQVAEEIERNFDRFIEVANDKSMEEKGTIFSLVKHYLGPDGMNGFMRLIEKALVGSRFDREALPALKIFILEQHPRNIRVCLCPTQFDIYLNLKRIKFIKIFPGDNYADFLSNEAAMTTAIKLANSELTDLITAANLQDTSFIEKVAILTDILPEDGLEDSLLNRDRLAALDTNICKTIRKLEKLLGSEFFLHDDSIDCFMQLPALCEIVLLLDDEIFDKWLQESMNRFFDNWLEGSKSRYFDNWLEGSRSRYFGGWLEDNAPFSRVAQSMRVILTLPSSNLDKNLASDKLSYNKSILSKLPNMRQPEFMHSLELLVARNQDGVIILSQIADSLAIVDRFVEKYKKDGWRSKVENFKKRIIPILLSPGSLTTVENKQALGKLAREIFTHDTVSSQLIDALLRCLDGILNCFRKVTTVISSAPTEGASFSFFHYYNKHRLQQEIEEALGISLNLNSNFFPPSPKN